MKYLRASGKQIIYSGDKKIEIMFFVAIGVYTINWKDRLEKVC